MKPAPSRLSPILVPRVWGSRDLRPLFAQPVDATEPIGEVWLTGDHCTFASGPLAGRPLGQAWSALPEAWTGRRAHGAPRLPLLVKFIFPDDMLSVQVHPDDDYARQHEAGESGKTEMWYAVSAKQNAELRLGLIDGVTRESFRQAIHDGTAEQCLRRFTVNTGDAFFVPAGTVHTIGPGMVLCEIQENSDLTYRIFDYNRRQSDGTPRQLHLRQALEVINFGPQSGAQVEPVEIERGPRRETCLAACRHFAVERWEFAQGIAAATSPDSFELLATLSGNGSISWNAETISYGPAELWFLPASLGEYQIAPQSPTSLLRSYVPDLQEYAEKLAGKQIEKAAWSRVVHW